MQKIRSHIPGFLKNKYILTLLFFAVWMVFFDDKTVAGPLGMREQLAYEYASEHLQEIGRTTSVSVATLSRLASVWKKNRQPGISAQELAVQLQILPRSARRILTELERQGVISFTPEKLDG